MFQPNSVKPCIFLAGEVSSISGSDSDTDSDSDLTLMSSEYNKPSINDLLPEATDGNQTTPAGRQHPKVFFVSGEGEVLSIYRSVIYSVKVLTYLPACLPACPPTRPPCRPPLIQLTIRLGA